MDEHTLGYTGVGAADVEIISAVPLTAHQQQIIEVRLIRMMKKHITIKATVDPSLLGGIRIVTGDYVIDDTIKRKLFNMKSSMIAEVFES
ncbi:MAG: F0F1 ATP synthase subunit delta [Oscillospiraceae bacterium]|nr:F0F1 ATP synthase subunit delta [Oscillospiraceae bacterium]